MVRELRECIDRAVDRGDSLDEIDAAIIHPAPIPDDLKAALWLYAAGCLERPSELRAASSLTERLAPRSPAAFY